jgi:hypothetical protein
MPVPDNSLRYKDVAAAKGSELYEALAEKDMARAEAIYQRCERNARELLKDKTK